MTINIIGVLKEPDTLDDEGNIISEGKALDGFLVDSIDPLKVCDNYIVTPSSPVHSFYGVSDCYRYKFNSEVHYYELFPKVEVNDD